MNSLQDIKSCFIFSGIPLKDADLEGILIKNYKKGDTIYGKSSFKKAIGILLSGKASARSLGNKKTVLKSYEAGSVFGVAAVFCGYKNFVSEITAKSSCSVCFIGEEKLKALFKKYPDFAVNYISFLSSRIHFLNSEISLFTSGEANEKVFKYLINAADENGYVGKVVMTELSRKLSIGRTSLYRAFSELENNNKISRTNGEIKVIL